MMNAYGISNDGTVCRVRFSKRLWGYSKLPDRELRYTNKNLNINHNTAGIPSSERVNYKRKG